MSVMDCQLLPNKILISGKVGFQSDQITAASWSGNTCQPRNQLIITLIRLLSYNKEDYIRVSDSSTFGLHFFQRICLKILHEPQANLSVLLRGVFWILQSYNMYNHHDSHLVWILHSLELINMIHSNKISVILYRPVPILVFGTLQMVQSSIDNFLSLN